MRYGVKLLSVCIVLIFFISVRVYRWSQGKTGLRAAHPAMQETKDTKAEINKKNKYFKDAVLEEISFYAPENKESEKKILRKGLLLLKPNAQAVIVICHGFMCDKHDMSALRVVLSNAKYPYSILMFDFRGHGEQFNEDGERVADQVCTLGAHEKYDILAAVNHLKERPDTRNLPIIGYGFSMGAVSLFQAQAESEDTLCDLIIADGPFDSSDNLLKRSIDKIKVSVLGFEFDIPGKDLLHRNAYHPYVQAIIKYGLKMGANMDTSQVNTYMFPVSTLEAAKKVKKPCLLICCLNDEKVPVRAVKSIYDNLQGYKRLWITNGRRHCDSLFYSPEKYCYKVMRFIEKFMEGGLISTRDVQKVHQDSIDDQTLYIKAQHEQLNQAPVLVNMDPAAPVHNIQETKTIASAV